MISPRALTCTSAAFPASHSAPQAYARALLTIAPCPSMPCCSISKLPSRRHSFLENVLSFGKVPHGSNSSPLSRVVKFLKQLNLYTIFDNVLNTADFGIPQQRERVYMVGIQTRLIRLPFQWPDRIRATRLSKFWDRTATGRIVKSREVPQDLLLKKTSFVNLRKAWKDMVKLGLNPEQTDAIVDIGAGKGYGSFRIGECPTITPGRGKGFGFYSTMLTRPLSLTEMMRLQGADPKKIDLSIISKTQAAGVIGNAMSVNLMEAIIVSILVAVGGPDALPFN